MEALLGYAPFLILLACPLMMVLCFLGMRRMGHSTESTPATASVPVRLGQAAPAEQIADLQARLSQLQAEQTVIAQQIAGLASQAQAATAADMSDLPRASETFAPATS